MTELPRQVTMPDFVLVAAEILALADGDGEDPKAFIEAPVTTPPIASIARSAPSHLSRRRRSRCRASLNSTSIVPNVDSSPDVGTEFGFATLSIEATIIVFMSSVKPAERDEDEAEFALVRLDRSDPTLLHEQVAAEIRRAIGDGEAGPGERIPQAKDLASELGVNTNTVLRALRVLRDEGLIEMGRGRSIRVTKTPERGIVAVKLKELVDVARQQGYRRDDLVVMLQKMPSR